METSKTISFRSSASSVDQSEGPERGHTLALWARKPRGSLPRARPVPRGLQRRTLHTPRACCQVSLTAGLCVTGLHYRISRSATSLSDVLPVTRALFPSPALSLSLFPSLSLLLHSSDRTCINIPKHTHTHPHTHTHTQAHTHTHTHTPARAQAGRQTTRDHLDLSQVKPSPNAWILPGQL